MSDPCILNPDWSRCHGVRPGEDFYDAIWLDGFEEQSIWGYDTGTGGFFAQVWQNGSANEQPDLWLTAPMTLPCAQALLPAIVEFTGHDPLAVVRAMGIARPNPTCVPDTELKAYLEELCQRPDNDVTAGETAACRWMLGLSDIAPSSESRTPSGDGLRPLAVEVDAEAAHATGNSYLRRRDYDIGVETGLIKALAR